MKKIITLSAAVLLFSGIAFSQSKGGDKGKEKGKKSQTSGKKSCPGKECGKESKDSKESKENGGGGKS